MSWRHRLMKNTALLTASSLGMRLLGMVWQVWLARRLGSAGIGLLQLVMSVGFFFSTLAISGIRYTVTRLIAEELGQNRPGSVGRAMERAFAWALCFGCAALAGLFFGADSIARHWVGDGRIAAALRYLAFSLPVGAVGSVLAGYFTAVGRVWKNAAHQLLEQLLRMGFTAAALAAAGEDPGRTCAAVTAAGALAEGLGCLVLGLFYRDDRRRHTLPGSVGPALTGRMVRLAAPLALSAWARSGLGTLRQMLVPRCLRLSGLGSETALALYGVVTGMVMPVLLFPTCLPAALAEVLVPLLTEKQVSGERDALRTMARTLLSRTLLLSGGAAAFFFLAADLLGGALYHSAEAAGQFRRLALLTPLIYTDIVTDGFLKGLGEMNRSMLYNLAEAALGLVLSALLLPRFGMSGYILTLYLCEGFNFTLSLRRLWVLLHQSESQSVSPLSQES